MKALYGVVGREGPQFTRHASMIWLPDRYDRTSGNNFVHQVASVLRLSKIPVDPSRNRGAQIAWCDALGEVGLARC
jgi:hypothetical protein